MNAAGAMTPSQQTANCRTLEECVETEVESVVFTPPIDIYEGPDGLVLEADIPGATESDVQIEVEENVLTLRAKVARPESSGMRALHQEYGIGDFERSFILSDEVVRDEISASFDNGVLTLRLPKAERARTRSIPVNPR